jgi:putative flippase GtrA
MELARAYTIFALIATLANIGVQDLVIRLYQGAFHLIGSVIMGTGAGLLVKYALDKRYIFRFQPRDLAHDGRTFFLYTLMGLATTVIFWGFEFGFEYLFANRGMRYLGGVIGLAIGYVAKYHLDKQFVFRMESA